MAVAEKKRLPTIRQPPPPLCRMTPPTRGAANTSTESAAGSDKSLPITNGRPPGSRKQSPAFNSVGSATPSTASQHCPETIE